MPVHPDGSVLFCLHRNSGQLAMQTVVNSLGTAAVAGYTAASKADQLSVLVNNAMMTAISNYVAQNFGAERNWERIVAQAAPATPIWNGTINRISRKIFKTEENTRKKSGVLLSPSARSILEIIL